MNENNPIIGKDISFEQIDGQLLRLIDFKPMEKSFFNPYAFVTVESTCFKRTAILPVFQRTDFKNLSEAWKQREGDEEILIFWSVKHYSNKIFKLLSSIFPKLWVRICPKDSFKIESDRNFKPELTGEARFLATQATKQWKPSVFD